MIIWAIFLTKAEQSGTSAEQKTTWTYTLSGQQASVTDASGKVTTDTYDMLGRLTKEVAPGSMTTWYTYNAAGEQIQIDASDGTTTTNTFDDLGRVTEAKKGHSMVCPLP